MDDAERIRLENERFRDLLRLIYSDARTPADLRVRVGIALGWLPIGATIADLPTPTPTSSED